MEVKAKQPFTEFENGSMKVFNKGDKGVIENEDRAAELIKAGLCVEVKKLVASKDEAEPKKPKRRRAAKAKPTPAPTETTDAEDDAPAS